MEITLSILSEDDVAKRDDITGTDCACVVSVNGQEIAWTDDYGTAHSVDRTTEELGCIERFVEAASPIWTVV